jgi:CheY-like chemotaxis protein/HPt (histidine-containing phosphotransfer) domain-containing protein
MQVQVCPGEAEIASGHERAGLVPPEPNMLLHLSRASFWLAAVAAAWALVAPGQHETALTGVAGAAALLAFALWRAALAANRRSFAGDAAVPQPALLTSASLVEAAAAVVRIADEAASLESALRSIAAVLKAELGAREAHIHDLVELGGNHAQIAEWLPNGAGLRAPPRRIGLQNSTLGAAISSGREVSDLPRTVVVPIAQDGSQLVLIELQSVEMTIDEPALTSLLELTRLCGRAVGRRVGSPLPGGSSGPAAAPIAAPADPTDPPDSLVLAHQFTAHVLVVEDKVVQSETTARLLRRLGCRVTMASGMLEGLHALCATQFDLVLMETHMPGIGATEALSWLRGRPQGAFKLVSMRDTPVVALAVQGLQGDAGRFRELGFDDCLFKPLGRRQVQAMLTKHLRLQAPRAEADGTGSTRAPTGDDVLDPAALARLRELDPKGENQLLERVLKAFQTSAARLLPQLLAARESNDRTTVRLVAHTLKSSSASIGANTLSQLCGELEATIRNDTGDDIEPGIAAMTAGLDVALQAIQRQLART